MRIFRFWSISGLLAATACVVVHQPPAVQPPTTIPSVVTPAPSDLTPKAAAQAVVCVPALKASNDYVNAPKPLVKPPGKFPPDIPPELRFVRYNRKASIRLARALHELVERNSLELRGTPLLRVLNRMERAARDEPHIAPDDAYNAGMAELAYVNTGELYSLCQSLQLGV
jgi:hypothetical protein